MNKFDNLYKQIINEEKEHWFFTNSKKLEVYTYGSGDHPTKTHTFEDKEEFDNFIKKLKEDGYTFQKDQG